MGKEIFMNIDPKTIQNLVSAAISVRQHAYAPNSCYCVGAALMCGKNTIITGCNIESPSSQFVCCAERLTLLKALADGMRTFTAIAVATEDAQAPCGTCLQFLYEWCADLPVIITKPDGTHRTSSICQLLTQPFKSPNKCQ